MREHNDGLYRPAVYLVFKMVDELALNWLVGLVTCAIIFFGIQLQGSYLFFWLVIMSTLSNGIGVPCSRLHLGCVERDRPPVGL